MKLKSITCLILMTLSAISIPVAGIWVCVSFIVYLAKDLPFNWIVFWWWIIAFIALLVTYIWSSFIKRTDASQQFSVQKKSGFLQRIEEAQRKRNQQETH